MKKSLFRQPLYFYFIVGLNVCLICILFLWFAQTRNIDGDEGLYLEAARLVAQGKKLYLDFFYQQMPLIPYLYAGWMKLFGFSLYSSRWLSALLMALSGAAVLIFVARRTRNLLITTLCAVLFFANGLVLAWAPVIKTHPFNAFTLTVSCILLLEWRRREKKSDWMLMLAGILIGIGVNCRLTLAPFPLLYLFFIFFNSETHRFRRLLLFTLACVATFIPSIYYWALAPELFYKYNFLYHTQVYPGMAKAEVRLKVAKEVFWTPQFFILGALAYLGLLLESRQGWKRFFASDSFFVAVLILTFIFIHLGTATPFTQYFSAIIPLMVLATLPVLQKLVEAPASFQTMVLVPSFLVYLVFTYPTIKFELYSVGSAERHWSLKSFNIFSYGIKKVVEPNDYCLTWWPGYAFAAGCTSVPGMENHMREHAILEGVGKDTLTEYKLLPSEELIQLLEDRKYRVVIDGVYRLSTPYNEYIEYLLQENYELRGRIYGVKIYTWKEVKEEKPEKKLKGKEWKTVGKKI